MDRRKLAIAAGGIGALAFVISERVRPAPCPYAQRWLLEVPRPFLSRADVVEVLAPKPGEAIIEIGPGPGYHSLAVARRGPRPRGPSRCVRGAGRRAGPRGGAGEPRGGGKRRAPPGRRP